MPNKSAAVKEKYRVVSIRWHFQPYSGTYVQKGVYSQNLGFVEIFDTAGSKGLRKP
jgi:hypothetical protein